MAYVNVEIVYMLFGAISGSAIAAAVCHREPLTEKMSGIECYALQRVFSACCILYERVHQRRILSLL